MRNPVALGSTGGNSSVTQSSSQLSSSVEVSSSVVLSSSVEVSSSIVISSSEIISSSELVSSSAVSGENCDGISAWEERVYNWTGVKEYVVYNTSLYSHTGWVNATTPASNSSWLLEGACGGTTSSQAQSSVAASSSSVVLSSSEIVSSSSIEISSSIELSSSIALSSSVQISSSEVLSSSSVSASVCEGVAQWSTITSWAQFAQGDTFTDGTQVATCNAHPAFCYTGFANSYWTSVSSCTAPAPIAQQAKMGVRSDEITSIVSFVESLGYSSGILNIGQNGDYQVTVMSISGQTVFSKVIRNEKSIELKLPSSGLYFVNVKSATQSKTIKIIQ
jgi:hypothetical protein